MNEFILTQEIQDKINFILLRFNATFNWNLYDKEKYNIPEWDYNLFFELRKSWKEISEILNNLLELLKKYPDWSYLIYEIGYTYALLWDFKNAEAYYNKLLKIEERWFFNAITEHFIINKIISREFDEKLFKIYVNLFDTPIWSILEKESEILIKEYSHFSPLYIQYILSLLINKKLEHLDKIFQNVKLLDLDMDTKAKIKALEYVYHLLKWDKNIELLKWIYNNKTSLSIDNLADFIYFDIK